MSLINFESLTEIKEKKNLEREARQLILDETREKYERCVKREQEARERGETTWMLPSVEDKINHKQREKKKKKKDKKEKTKKKKKKKKISSSSSSSTSGNESENEKSDTWVEKTPNDQATKREEWMEISSLFKTQTREQMRIADRSSRELKKLEERKRKEDENKPGSHARELNPYYKEGGIGLPSDVPSNTVKISSYDASWLRKALQRAKDQAAEEGKTLEEVAAARWGSLDTFYKLLNEAENGGDKSSNLTNKDERECESTDRQERHREDYFGEKKRRESKIKKRRSRSRSRERRKINRSRSRERRRSLSRTKDTRKNKRSGSREKNKRVQKNNTHDNSRNKSRSRSRSREENRCRSRSRSSSSDRSSSSSSSSSSDSSNSRRRRRRQRNDSDSSIERKRSISRYHERTKEPKNEKSEKLQMLKPPESDDEMTYSTRRQFQKPDDAMDISSDFEVQRSFVKKNKSASWRKKEPEVAETISGSKTRSPKSKDGSSSSSSTSDSDEEEKISELRTSLPEAKPTEVVPVLTDKEMNQLAAKLTKAELLGNTVLVDKLKLKLDAARNAREKHCGGPSDLGQKHQEERDDSVVILTRTDKTGFTRPVDGYSSDNRGSKKKKMNMYDSDGKRTSYFGDDFKTDLRDMFEKEKTTSAEDQIAFLENMPQYTREKLSDDFDVDDMFIAKVAPKESREKERERDRKRAVWEHQKSQKVLDSCHFCIDNKLLKKHLIVALGKKCYVSLPYHQSLTEGHCMIVPLNHVPCGTQAEEDLWEEITSFRQALVRMFSSNDEDCVFFETATKLHQMPHMVLQCIPLPKETGDLAPIYFKKAILECDEEWAQNKKLIDLQGKTVRKAVPKELPYFYVDFGMTPGFAHVIENELLFPNNFAQEIIGGMIDADYSLFRKPKAENFDLQRKKVLKFGKMFQPFDPTENN